MVKYYWDSWIQTSDILAPLAKQTGKNTKWEWNEEANKAFNTIKQVVSREVLLSYPNFNEIFYIYTDTSEYQLGVLIVQNIKHIAFYSHNMAAVQLNYTTTNQEFMAMVETLKEFRRILLGQRIVVYTYNKKLTYKVFNTDQVTR